ncbi:MAG: hypothetical protein H6607_12945 [Flavobacteriales bacterium]|nr:hypothetical protein [Flavobacteriales bacterium]
MRKFSLVIAIFCLGLPLGALAQLDTSKSIDIVVLGQYRPKLSMANKIITNPDVEPVKGTTPTFTYNLPNFAYSVLPTYRPAPAIGVKSEMDEPLFGNYFKLGAGNYVTPYAEFRVHSVRNKAFNYGVYGTHLSSNAGNPKNADFSDNRLGVMGEKVGKKANLTGKLNYERHVVHFYGYDDTFNFEKVQINQIFNDFNGILTYNRGYETMKIGTLADFKFYTLSAHASGLRENNYDGGFAVRGKMKGKNEINFRANVDYTQLFDGGKSVQNRTFIRIKPNYSFVYVTPQKIDLDVKAGLNTVVALDSNGSKVYVFPDIYAEHFLVPKKVVAFAQIGGDVQKNALRQLSYINPFMGSNVAFKNTINEFSAVAGLRGVILKKLDYLLKIKFSADKNLPLFLTDTFATRTFGVVYDNVKTTGFTSGFGFRLNERFFIQAAATLYSYNTTFQSDPWQLPLYDIDLNTRMIVAKKLNLRAQAYFIGDRIAKDRFEKGAKPQTLPPILDFNLMADYRYKKNISFFLNVNNISSVRYQKWYGYKSYGINLLAGITFSL